MGDYRFPICNLFRKQIAHGFEETHTHTQVIIYIIIIVGTGRYMKILRLAEKKNTKKA